MDRNRFFRESLTLDGILVLLHVDDIDGGIGAETLTQFRQLGEIGGAGQVDSVVVKHLGRLRCRRIGGNDDKLLIAAVAPALGRAADAAVSRAAGPGSPVQLLLNVTVVH